MNRSYGGAVWFSVPRPVAFDYLSDPTHRPQWQSSLARVADVRGEPGQGQTWRDITRPGLAPRMTTTVFDRPERWAETGTWRFVRAELTLTFRDSPTRDGCRVECRLRIDALGPIGLLLTLAAVPAVRADLRRAARILSAAEGS